MAAGPCAKRAAPGTVDVVIGYLSGTARGPRLVDVGGVGYVVSCPRDLPVGEHVELLVTTIVRDDAISLYGFTDEASQAVFGALCKVSRVGPSVALALLRDLGPAGVVAAVAGRDPGALTRAAGVGRKLAETIVSMCELPAGVDAEPACGPVDEVAAALDALGYDPATALAAARAAAAGADADADTNTLLLGALAHIRGAA